MLPKVMEDLMIHIGNFSMSRSEHFLISLVFFFLCIDSSIRKKHRLLIGSLGKNLCSMDRINKRHFYCLFKCRPCCLRNFVSKVLILFSSKTLFLLFLPLITFFGLINLIFPYVYIYKHKKCGYSTASFSLQPQV
jgi:hypothetical protein